MRKCSLRPQECFLSVLSYCRINLNPHCKILIYILITIFQSGDTHEWRKDNVYYNSDRNDHHKKSLVLGLHRDIKPEQLRDKSPMESRHWLWWLWLTSDENNSWWSDETDDPVETGWRWVGGGALNSSVPHWCREREIFKKTGTRRWPVDEQLIRPQAMTADGIRIKTTGQGIKKVFLAELHYHNTHCPYPHDTQMSNKCKNLLSGLLVDRSLELLGLDQRS